MLWMFWNCGSNSNRIIPASISPERRRARAKRIVECSCGGVGVDHRVGGFRGRQELKCPQQRQVN